jgi:hypothetical protein
MPLTDACRLKALEAGLWTASDGSFVPIRQMHDAHLINTLLKALAAGVSPRYTRALAEEVNARGLRDAAFAEVERRRPRYAPNRKDSR